MNGTGAPQIESVGSAPRRAALQTLLHDTLWLDRERLRQALAAVPDSGVAEQSLDAIERRLRRSLAIVARRRALPISVDPDSGLPIVAALPALEAAIRAHPVVIVCGETGSGKSTQLPKLCAALGFGIHGRIGHTQPRRIAARTVAARIAEEVGCRLGTAVGYKVRFDDETEEQTRIKLMTDGILLEEMRADRLLRAYDAIIVDEAHERSINVDIILGLLRDLLPRRPELRVIVTSATLEPRRFTEFFAGAPVVEVAGRGHPVEIRYRPADAETPESPGAAVAATVRELVTEGPGDLLAFLPTERDIREAAEWLRRDPALDADVVPLYSRLDLGAQRRVFAPHARRHVVLATNVAETAVTVPGVRYVVDTGLARVRRYSTRAKIERLPVEAIAQSAADQRAGRCGRVGPGICVRLYRAEDYAARAPHTEPEVRRSNLAGVILRLRSLGVQRIERFGFVDPPDSRQISDGYRLLAELGAIDPEQRLTTIGRELADLPVDPRVGRMLLAARDLACFADVAIIAAALSVADPRERPLEMRAAADAAHAHFAAPRSDFLWFLNAWRALSDEGLSPGALRRFARQHFLSPQRLREWRETWEQLRALGADRRWPGLDTTGDFARVHRALLTGLLGHVARREPDGSYLGARGLKMRLHPGSSVRTPHWIMAAEIVETSRVFARVVATVSPRWIMAAGAHLVERRYSDPAWDRRSGRVLVSERVNLFGLTLAAGRRVELGAHDAAAAREIFLRDALVSGDLDGEARFISHNRALLAEVQEFERRARRTDLRASDLQQYDFFAHRVPATIHTQHAFDDWRKRAERTDRECLFMRSADAWRAGAPVPEPGDYPERIEMDGVAFDCEYRFEPGTDRDGLTVRVPLALLPSLVPARLDWLVPGWLGWKVEAMLRALPKEWRRQIIPLAAHAKACTARLRAQFGHGPLADRLRDALREESGVAVPVALLTDAALTPHLRAHVAVLGDDGAEIAYGDDAAALRHRYAAEAAALWERQTHWRVAHPGASDWQFGVVPESAEELLAGQCVRGYPALVDRQSLVAVTVFSDPARAALEHRSGLRRLVRLALPDLIKHVRNGLPDFERLVLAFTGVGTREALREDILDAAIDRAVLVDAAAVRDGEAFRRAVEMGRGALFDAACAVAREADSALQVYRGVRRRLVEPIFSGARADIDSQLAGLVYPGFLGAGAEAHAPVRHAHYLAALLRRVEKLPRAPGADAERLAQLQPLWQRLQELPDWRNPIDRRWNAWRWRLEELRVSLFAQELGAAPVSVQRLRRELAEL